MIGMPHPLVSLAETIYAAIPHETVYSLVAAALGRGAYAAGRPDPRRVPRAEGDLDVSPLDRRPGRRKARRMRARGY